MQQQAQPRLVYGLKKAEAARRRRDREATSEVGVASDGILAGLWKFFQ